MAPIDSQTTNWQCTKNVNGIPCGNGNVITQIQCKSANCGQERSKGDLAMSIMDEVLGVFNSRDDVKYDDTADAYGPLNYGNTVGSRGGYVGFGGLNNEFNDGGYRPALSARDEALANEQRARLSRRGRCNNGKDLERKRY